MKCACKDETCLCFYLTGLCCLQLRERKVKSGDVDLLLLLLDNLFEGKNFSLMPL